MSTRKNSVERHGKQSTYTSREHKLCWHTARRVIATAPDNAFIVSPFDGTLIVNTGTNVQNATAVLPPIQSVKRGQTIIIQNCDPTGIAGSTLSITADGVDLINEAPGVTLLISLPNMSRKIQRVVSGGIDSWYTVCCKEVEQA